ncbi:MAG: hypothetical protein PHE87_03255 [Victivallaceae bacterium]|nr:hypothetical protein [Victivallaceae bacterium]
MKKHLTLQKLCGSYQYLIKSPEDLREIMNHDNALWAALSAPIHTLNGDPLFFKHLDSSKSGSIRVDDIKSAFQWLDEVLVSPDILEQEEPAISPDEINQNTKIGMELLKGIQTLFRKELDDNVITLAETRSAMARLQSGHLKGDGIINESAVEGTAAKGLFNDIVTVLGGTPNAAGITGITAPMLDRFLKEANAYLEWAAKNDSYSMLMPGVDMPPAYAIYRAVASKIDQYFSFSQLLQIDPANALRFEEDPKKLSPLDLVDDSAVAKALADAPLTHPSFDGLLKISGDLNPHYRDNMIKLAEIFDFDEISIKEWNEIKNKFAPYEAYLNEKSALSTEKLGTERLKDDVANQFAIELLRELMAKDSTIMDNLKLINLVERLLLFKQYYFRFVQSYISFFELFNPERLSMMQAGSLIMDGKHFDLCIRINDIEAHKKISIQSNLFIIYMKARRSTNDQIIEQLIAVAITAGSSNVFYRGKPGLLEGWDGNLWDTTIVDILPGPICFWQSLTLPFLKLGNTLSQKLEKLASADAISNEFANTLQAAGKTPATAKPGMVNGPMLLLAGGVGFAAVFSGITYVFKQLSSMPGLHLAYYALLIFLCLMSPLIIYSLIKLYKRNLGVFFEAAGWAINLRMKLDSIAGRFFSYFPAYPKESRFIRIDTASIKLKKNSRNTGRKWLVVVIMIGLAIAALIGGYYIYVYKFSPESTENVKVINEKITQDKEIEK